MEQRENKTRIKWTEPQGYVENVQKSNIYFSCIPE